jgi:non-ribosomal peptide synthetase component F
LHFFRWNDTAAAYPNACIHQLFEAQVDRTPFATAVSFGRERLTYQDLNRSANQLAHFLRASGVHAKRWSASASSDRWT